MSWMRVVDALKQPVGSQITVKGWVRTRRDSKAEGGLSFIAIHDGSCFDTIQAVVKGPKTVGVEAPVSANDGT